MLKSYKYRLYPSKKQIVKLEATLDTCRHLYNDALGNRKLQAEWAGKVVTFVNPKNISQECSRCGKIVKKNLNIKIHHCPYCGLVIDRHVNAAINILHRGLKKVGLGYTDFMPVRSQAQDRPMTQEANDFSRG